MSRRTSSALWPPGCCSIRSKAVSGRRGVDVTVYNRTRAKTESLAKLGAHVVSRPVDLADRDIVITTVSDSKDFVEVVAGPHGLLSDRTRAPSLLIDASTVSMEVSAEMR